MTAKFDSANFNPVDFLLQQVAVPAAQSDIGDATMALGIVQERPDYYQKLGRRDATLFSYALYNILKHDSRCRLDAEDVLQGLEKAYPELQEALFGEDRCLNIILDEQELINCGQRDFSRVSAYVQQRLHLVEQAYSGYIRKEADRIYRAFMNENYRLPVAAVDSR